MYPWPLRIDTKGLHSLEEEVLTNCFIFLSVLFVIVLMNIRAEMEEIEETNEYFDMTT